jgi:outer membrane protein assembly factor BamB
LNRANNVVLPGTLRTAWSVESGAPISASPSVVDGTLFLGNNAGRFLAIDVRTGRVRWRASMPDALMTAPLVVGDDVIVGEGNENSMVRRGVVHVGSGDDALIAFDRRSGTLRWRSAVAGTAMPTPVYLGGRILAHNGDGELVALMPQDGRIVYVRDLGTIPSMVALLPISRDALVTGGQTETSIVAVRASDGSVIWRRPFPGGSGLGDCPLVSDGRRIFGDYLLPAPHEPFVLAGRRNEERAYALDARTGAPLWDVHLENGIVPQRNQAAIPLLHENTLFIGSSVARMMHALDPETGRLRWRRRVGGTVKGGLVATRGTVFFGDLSGRLWALRERDGAVAGVANAGTPFNVGSPIVVGETLVIGSLTGRILALPLGTLLAARDVAAAPERVRAWLAPRILARFRSADLNGDGVLTRGEFARAFPPAAFARVDRNGDGAITPLEFGMSFGSVVGGRRGRSADAAERAAPPAAPPS